MGTHIKTNVDFLFEKQSPRISKQQLKRDEPIH